MSNAFDAPHFQTPENAREWLEKTRWSEGPVCPHCGTVGRAYKTKRLGTYRCAEKECRKDFSVTTGTVMERSHIALNKWLMGFYLMAASKKGISAHQLSRSLGLDYKSAWFMCHRIREAMRPDDFPGSDPLGGAGQIVEADETYFGQVEERRPSKQRGKRPFTKGGKSGPGGKRAVVSLVERGGRVRSFHPAFADGATVAAIVRENIRAESRLNTDESRLYTSVGREFAAHETVNHTNKEYARGDVTTNSVEGFFSIFKRGMKGVYQHCGEKHLHRYLAEFDFRYNHRVKLGYSDIDRTIEAVKGIEGKRLMYKQAH
jgi:transposase-like protein